MLQTSLEGEPSEHRILTRPIAPPVAVARDQLGPCELGTREPQHPIAPRALDVSGGPALKAHREPPLAHPACGQLGQVLDTALLVEGLLGGHLLAKRDRAPLA